MNTIEPHETVWVSSLLSSPIVAHIERPFNRATTVYLTVCGHHKTYGVTNGTLRSYGVWLRGRQLAALGGRKCRKCFR